MTRDDEEIDGGSPFVMPVKGGSRRTMSSRFGQRQDPITGAGESCHLGIDFALPEGTPVYAAAGGRVTTSLVSATAGNYIIIDHDDGLKTEYMHLRDRDVDAGELVEQGEQIGTVGTTGNSTGPHLHFGLFNDGERVDPSPYLGLPSGAACE